MEIGISNVSEIPDFCLGLPATGSAENNALHTFIDKITSDKPFCATIQIIRYVFQFFLSYY